MTLCAKVDEMLEREPARFATEAAPTLDADETAGLHSGRTPRI